MLFVAVFVCLNNLVFRVRVPVGVFYLNMSKKDLCARVCVRACACVRVCVLMINKAIIE